MDSLPSTSTSPPYNHHFHPPQSLTERVLRALSHHIRLLHRSNSDFYVLGATGNVYTVTLSPTPTCTCPDRTTPCKHILFVYIRVLSLSLDDTCIWRKTLRPCQLTRLLSLPIQNDAVAGPTARERFHELFLTRQGGGGAAEVVVEEGDICPICLEEMKVVVGRIEKVVACGTCKNPIHEECLLAWKRSRQRRSVSCVICRARWRNRADVEKYLNLSAYVSEDGDMVDQQGGGGGEANYCGGNN